MFNSALPRDTPVLPPLNGRRVLVVEDEYVLADDLRAELEARGAKVIGPVATLLDGLNIVQQGPVPDLAILDINLQGEMVYPLADVLRELGVPFLFATGYDAQAIPVRYADVPRAEKPVELARWQEIATKRTA
ncbi:response regulator [Rubellimicrobium roseum]|uniref:Response regulator n=1 Tax=Rubellimicrobium roseum TaxID=687525 RepID=A0A5C4NDD2_9RHOB|nr:response regulator [Rubellimicrobium roseum]TNC67572.1 response regulator [Rubellimicrobium roseum]